MATTETRLLLLGAVSLFEPVNGYQIRRELVSWGVEEWAKIKPGSIYNGLATLAQRGELLRHDVRDNGREVAVYETTAQGREEFSRLYRLALTEVRPTSPLGFQTAFSMLPLVTRAEVLAMLRERLANLDEAAARHAGDRPDESHVPPHVLAMMDYWEGAAQVERDWLVALIARIDAGELAFQGEPMDWTPAPDDPGHQMSADRERYRVLLHR